MTATVFLTLLFMFSVLSGLMTEGIKKLISDRENLSYNLIALVTALIVGGGGTFIYYFLAGVDITGTNILYIVLMGLASGLGSMVGYDKVAQLLQQFTAKK